MEKIRLGVIFGGKSTEYSVSLHSVGSMLRNCDTNKYEIHCIGITQDGDWYYLPNPDYDKIEHDHWVDENAIEMCLGLGKEKGIVLLDGKNTRIELDVIFPVLHGKNGEDGTLQGYLDLAQIPYVGCGVLASAVSMDKLYTKIIVDTLHIRQAQYVPVLKKQLEDMDTVVARVEEKLSYPVFVKPSNAGSSQGVSKAHDRAELVAALELAVKHDRKSLVEETIIGREIECAVLGGKEVKASGVGEILAAADFYDYEAKYNNPESKTVISPELPEGVTEKIRKAAVEIFTAVDGFGLSRVDFFVEKDTNEVVFNEINTLPGFTSISMYPMLWAEQGIEKAQLIETLIEMAYER